MKRDDSHDDEEDSSCFFSSIDCSNICCVWIAFILHSHLHHHTYSHAYIIISDIQSDITESSDAIVIL